MTKLIDEMVTMIHRAFMGGYTITHWEMTPASLTRARSETRRDDLRILEPPSEPEAPWKFFGIPVELLHNKGAQDLAGKVKESKLPIRINEPLPAKSGRTLESLTKHLPA